jgi:hypothetical protein
MSNHRPDLFFGYKQKERRIETTLSMQALCFRVLGAE